VLEGVMMRGVSTWAVAVRKAERSGEASAGERSGGEAAGRDREAAGRGREAAGRGRGALRCERQAEYGYDTVRVELPAVISVGDAINEPRYPSLKAIMGAKKKPTETLSIADAGIEADRVGHAHARARCTDFAAPPAKAPGRRIPADDKPMDEDEIVAEIVAFLEQHKLLA
jgi:electron transfer flavoprotein alpha/beta subunit